MSISVEETYNLNFLNEISENQLYLNKVLNKNEIFNRLNYALMENSSIYIVRKEKKISCFFTYRKMNYLPSWVMSNLFIIDHSYFSPNTLGFGYAMDEAVKKGESENLYSFLWICEKSKFLKRYIIGMKDIKKRNSILSTYTFHILHDSEVHKNYKIFDYLIGNSDCPMYTIMANKNINIDTI